MEEDEWEEEVEEDEWEEEECIEGEEKGSEERGIIESA